MSWNNAFETKQFKEKMEKEKKIYKDLGMNEEDIKSIQSLDFEEFKSNRRFYEHTCPIELTSFDINDGMVQQPLKNRKGLSTTDGLDENREFWWMDELENKDLYRLIEEMPFLKKYILDLVVYKGWSQSEAARETGVSVKTVNSFLNSFYSKARAILSKNS